jgi:tetratricopeptide (TPR) repeat protein
VGLADPLAYGYLRLDPALGPLLLGELTENEHAGVRDRWAEALAAFAAALYRAQFGDNPAMGSALTLLDLPNLLGALEHLARGAPADRVIEVAIVIESLLQNLGRPKALGQASRVREAAAVALGAWSHARCLAESEAVDRLLDAGRYREALGAAESVLARAQAAGEDAYDGAPYDLAMSLWQIGRARKQAGDGASALPPLREAQERFQRLADAGDRVAARMVSVAITESGDSLQTLGRLDEAALAYEESIKLDERRGTTRDVAVGKGQLGTVRLLQQRYPEALSAFEDARRTFEQLAEPRYVAVSWHQIGVVHKQAGKPEAAERAFQASLRIKVQTGNHSGEAATLGELGTLYNMIGRLEEAVSFHRRAATLYAELHDLAGEGRQRNNLALTLFSLGRHDEARAEVLQAIQSKQPFGEAAGPWNAFATLAKIERASGNGAASSAARQRALDSYLAYRRAGGENTSGSARIFRLVEQAIAANQARAADEQLAALATRPDLPAYLKPLLPKLQLILHGSRDPSLADDAALDYDDAAELTLLLESLAAAAPA